MHTHLAMFQAKPSPPDCLSVHGLLVQCMQMDLHTGPQMGACLCIVTTLHCMHVCACLCVVTTLHCMHVCACLCIVTTLHCMHVCVVCIRVCVHVYSDYAALYACVCVRVYSDYTALYACVCVCVRVCVFVCVQWLHCTVCVCLCQLPSEHGNSSPQGLMITCHPLLFLIFHAQFKYMNVWHDYNCLTIISGMI